MTLGTRYEPLATTTAECFRYLTAILNTLLHGSFLPFLICAMLILVTPPKLYASLYQYRSRCTLYP